MTRKEAQISGETYYTTCSACKKCGQKRRYTSTGNCVSCFSLVTAEYARKNRERINAINRANWPENTKRKQRQLEWQRNNRDTCRRASSNWAKNNPIKAWARSSVRRAAKLQASPSWVDRDQLGAVYAEARRLTSETGIQYHVDHIVPLQHPLVCGLHVPWNLQVLTAEENIRKGNTFTPE